MPLIQRSRVNKQTKRQINRHIQINITTPIISSMKNQDINLIKIFAAASNKIYLKN